MTDLTNVAVHTVTIGVGLEATWVFADYDDAQAFRKAVEDAGRDAIYDEQIIIGHEGALQAIKDEAERDG